MMNPYAEFLLDFDKKHGGLTHGNSGANTRPDVIVESRPTYFFRWFCEHHVLLGSEVEPLYRVRAFRVVNPPYHQGLVRLAHQNEQCP